MSVDLMWSPETTQTENQTVTQKVIGSAVKRTKKLFR